MSAAKKVDSQLHEKTVELQLELTSKNLNEIFDSIKDINEKVIVTLDFSKCTKVENACYPIIHKIKNHLLKIGGEFWSTNVPLSVISQLQSSGIVGLFNIKTDKSNTKKSIDVNFITPFINSTINTLSIQANVNVTAGAPQLKVTYKEQVDIVGVISLMSNVFVGSISLCFPKNTFLNVCNKLFGEDHTEINSEIEDAAGELLNMIFGSAKAELNKNPAYQIQKALPTIISGSSLKLKQSKGPTIVLPFQSDSGIFHLEIEAVEK